MTHTRGRDNDDWKEKKNLRWWWRWDELKFNWKKTTRKLLLLRPTIIKSETRKLQNSLSSSQLELYLFFFYFFFRHEKMSLLGQWQSKNRVELILKYSHFLDLFPPIILYEQLKRFQSHDSSTRDEEVLSFIIEIFIQQKKSIRKFVFKLNFKWYVVINYCQEERIKRSWNWLSCDVVSSLL